MYYSVLCFYEQQTGLIKCIIKENTYLLSKCVKKTFILRVGEIIWPFSQQQVNYPSYH